MPYSKESVTNFLAEVVYDGNNDSSVLGRYEQFIIGCASK
jgi:hypothetical protein